MMMNYLHAVLKNGTLKLTELRWHGWLLIQRTLKVDISGSPLSHKCWQAICCMQVEHQTILCPEEVKHPPSKALSLLHWGSPQGCLAVCNLLLQQAADDGCLMCHLSMHLLNCINQQLPKAGTQPGSVLS